VVQALFLLATPAEAAVVVVAAAAAAASVYILPPLSSEVSGSHGCLDIA
jgi:hypothetical protein